MSTEAFSGVKRVDTSIPAGITQHAQKRSENFRQLPSSALPATLPSYVKQCMLQQASSGSDLGCAETIAVVKHGSILSEAFYLFFFITVIPGEKPQFSAPNDLIQGETSLDKVSLKVFRQLFWLCCIVLKYSPWIHL